MATNTCFQLFEFPKKCIKQIHLSINFHMYFDDSKLEKRRIWHVGPSDLIIKVLQDR